MGERFLKEQPISLTQPGDIWPLLYLDRHARYDPVHPVALTHRTSFITHF